MAYAEVFEGVKRDELQGGCEVPVRIWNVNVGASAAISRGDLLCGTSMSGIFSVVGGASDASKILTIAATDLTADSLGGVAQVYSSGVFNREKITFGGNSALKVEDFEPELRRQNIHLTSIQEKF